MWTAPLLLLLGCSPGEDSAAPAEPVSALPIDGERPGDVLMISLDTTRPDLLGRYSGAGTTPNLDALLDRSVVFEDHRSCSNWTYDSMFCLMASQRTIDAGFLPVSDDEELLRAPDRVLMAAELLAERGWATHLVTSNRNFSEENNMVQGFETVDYERQPSATWVVDTAIGRMNTLDTEQPWYLHVHLIDPHTPYAPPEQYLGALDDLPPLEGYDLSQTAEYTALATDWKDLDDDTRALALAHLEARYLAELTYADAEIGRLLDEADARGLLDEALVVFVTDHGEQLYEHDKFGHGQSLYDVENRAIAAFSAPGLAPGSWTRATRHMDVWPSALAALGEERPGVFYGVPAHQVVDHPVRRGYHFDGDRVIQFAERDGIKLMYWWDGKRLLFNLRTEPAERTDVYDPEAQAVVELWPYLLKDTEQIDALIPALEPTDPGP